MKKYYVVNDKQEFLWEDGKFYPPFVKSSHVVDEEVAKHYIEQGCTTIFADVDTWPQFYDEVREEKKQRRRTYVRVSAFTLAAALDRLYEDENTYNVMLSMEDGEFLISFEYHRDYERLRSSGIPQTCEAPK